MEEFRSVAEEMGDDLRDPLFAVGLDKALNDLKTQLLDESGASKILVTAPSGRGKTLLAKIFCRDPQVQEKFNKNIFFFTFPKVAPSLIVIVRKIWIYKKKPVPDLNNEADATEHLKRFLEGLEPGPKLMVLDDVWKGSESFVNKLLSKIPECKILITSRDELPELEHTYHKCHLSPLNDDDAMTLFRHSAGWEDRESDIPDDIVMKMVDYYKQIPLALKIAAGSLRGKPVEFWRKRQKECSPSRTTSDDERLDTLISNLDFSNVLGEECLKDLASFPEDHRIPVTALIDMWTELYELDREEDSWDIIYDLKAKEMVSLKITREDANEVDDYYSQHFVTLHNMIRDSAIKNISKEPIGQNQRLIMNWNPESFQTHSSVENGIKARLASISTDFHFSSNWSYLELPEAEVLVLNIWTKAYVSPNFVERVKTLKALIVRGILNYAKLINLRWLGSLANLKRIRMERISLTKYEQFKNLQKMSLYMCRNIGEAFRNCYVKLSVLIPNLREMNLDFCDDLLKLPHGLCDIIGLKKLSISNSHMLRELPKDFDKLVKLEVLRLRSCSQLEELPDSIVKLSMLTTLDIFGCVSIKKLPEQIGDLRQLTNVNMNQCSSLSYLPDSFWDLEQPIDLVCNEDKKEAWEKYVCPENITIRSTEVVTNPDYHNP